MEMVLIIVVFVLAGYVFGKVLPRRIGLTSAIIMLAIAWSSYAYINHKLWSITSILLPPLGFLSGLIGVGLLLGAMFRIERKLSRTPNLEPHAGQRPSSIPAQPNGLGERSAGDQG